jgi:RHS repeat-associated protein
LLAALVALVVVSPGSQAPADPALGPALWAATWRGLVKLDPADGRELLRAGGTETVLRVALDGPRERLWAYRPGHLLAFDGDGRLLGTVPAPPPTWTSLFHVALAVDEGSGQVWLGLGRHLHRFDAAGQGLGTQRLPDLVEALAADAAGGRMWVATRTSVAPYDLAGSRGTPLPLGPNPRVRALAVDGATGEVWVALASAVRRYRPDGGLLVQAALAGVERLGQGGAGGVWAASPIRLWRLGTAGQVLVNHRPFADGFLITALAADPRDQSAWVASLGGIRHVGPGGEGLLGPIVPGLVRDLALAGGAVPPPPPPNRPPVAADDEVSTPEDTPVDIPVLGNDGDPDADPLAVTGVTQGATGTVTFTPSGVTYTPNPNATGSDEFTYTVSDGRGGTATATVRVTVTPVNDPPTVSLGGSTLAGAVPLLVTLTATASDVDGDALTYSWDFGDGTTIPNGGPSESHAYQTPGSFTARVTVSDGQASTEATVVVTPTGVPDPAAVAPPLAATATTAFVNATAFLYTGASPIQTGVADGTIEPKRAAVIRGRVLERSGAPLADVRVRILHHPELGETRTRGAGMFDLAVNGGGPLTVAYEKAGYFSAQRLVQVPWQDYVFAPDVVLIPPDPEATVIDLASAAPFQVARGRVVADEEGPRRATLLVPQGTVATFRMADGSTQPAPAALTVRLTEYTEGSMRPGSTGPLAMPSELPPTSGYTYYVELTADEALAAGAVGVEFNQPVVFYLENFLGMQVGEFAPVGFYDRQAGRWVGSPNGHVVKVVGVTGGAADLDTDGDGVADQGVGTGFGGEDLGITLAEREQVAGLYAVGQELWRVPTRHFSPGDINWPYGPPADAVNPNGQPPSNPDADKPPCDDCPACRAPGSIIECGNQILGESVPVVGTPLRLNYRSDRVPGRRVAYRVTIPVTGPSVPASLQRADVAVEVAGQRHEFAFPAAPGQTMTFEWDGRDGYGRTVQGRQWATVRVTFTYPAIFQASVQAFRQAWARVRGVSQINVSPTRGEIYLTRTSRVPVGAWDARDAGVGGWTLDVHHAYDPLGKVLYLGTGERRSEAESLAPIITTVAGNGAAGAPADGARAVTQPLLPDSVAAAPDGSVLVYNRSDNRIYRLDPDTGIITRFAGNGGGSGPLDGVPALDVRLGDHHQGGMAVGPDGSVYVTGFQRVRRIRPDGSLVETIAGTGVAGFSGDGGPATLAQLDLPRELAIGRDGTVFVLDYGNERIRRVDPDGTITTVVGTGVSANPVEGPALGTPIRTFGDGLAAAPDGGVYFLGVHSVGLGGFVRIYHVGPDGILRAVVGDPAGGGSTADGTPALEAGLPCDTQTYFLTTTAEGQLVYSELGCRWVRVLDPAGRVRTLAGVQNQSGFSGDGGPATQARLNEPKHLTVAPDGTVYVIDFGTNRRVRRIGSRFPSFAGLTDILLPSEDGGLIYRFGPDGRHLDTRHSLTGGLVWGFTYDAAGRLVGLTDGDGNVTTVERDGDGRPTAIVGPFGQRTTLLTDGGGYLARIENPAGEAHQLASTPLGLLTGMTTPRGHSYAFGYEAATGHLLTDADPAGGSQTLARAELPPDATRRLGHDVSTTTALGRVKGYRIEQLLGGDRRETSTAPDGTATTVLVGKNGTRALTDATGMTSTATLGADPRLGILAPVTTQAQVRTPAGRTRATSESRSAVLADPVDLLSLTELTETFTLNGRTTTSVYTAATRQFALTSAAGRPATAAIDALGRVTAEQLGGLAPRAYTYDARGRLASVTAGTGPEARTWTLAYNPEGYLATVTDPLGRVTAFTYDAAGRVRTQTLPDLRVVTYAYDASGNLASLAPPGRLPHAFAYTLVDLEASYDPPDVPGVAPDVTSTAYNLDRQVTGVSRADGQTITPTYDAAGRLAAVAFSRGAVTLAYHPTSGLVTGLTAPDGVGHAFTYDGELLTQHTLSGPVPGTVAWTYDNDFRVASQSVNGGNAVAFTYDADSLLTQAGSLALTRDPQSGLPTATSLGIVTSTTAYSNHAESLDHRVQASGADVYRAQYTRDALGRITRKIETVLGITDTEDYAYDLAGRLVGVTRNGVTAITYTYDPNGNRLSYTGPLGDVATTAYDAQDRLTQYGGVAFTYDAHGDLATRTDAGGTTAYTYDELGNLTRVVLPDGTTIDYVIDALNRRIGKKVNGTLVRRWLWDGPLRIVAELDGAGALVSRFVYGTRLNVPAYMVRGGATYRIVADHLGSPRLVIDTATGAVAQQMRHDEFGRVLQDTSPGFTPFGFAGGLYDPDTGLVRFGARDYDPLVGRWTAKDPIGFGGGLNHYAYVEGDPVNLVDPEGLDACKCPTGRGRVTPAPTPSNGGEDRFVVVNVNRGAGPVRIASGGSEYPVLTLNTNVRGGPGVFVRVAPGGLAKVSRLGGRDVVILGPGNYCLDELGDQIDKGPKSPLPRPRPRGREFEIEPNFVIGAQG